MVITYNHGPFIGRALESVLNQKTTFPFKIHVVEDASTDNTQAVCTEYHRRFPDKIVLFMNDKNIGNPVTQKNFIRGFGTLRSKYIAILEGDDYWDYPGKLQAQVDFLEKHPDFAACGHDTVRFFNDESLPSEIFLGVKHREFHTVHDLISIKSFFHTTTLVYRNVLKDRIPKNFVHPYSCDLFNSIAHADHGKFFYMRGAWSHWRVHSSGRFSSMPLVKGWFFNIDGLRRYNQSLNYRYLKTFARYIPCYCLYVLLHHWRGEVKLTNYQIFKLISIFLIYRLLYWAIYVGTWLPQLFSAVFSPQTPLDLNEVSFLPFLKVHNQCQSQ